MSSDSPFAAPAPPAPHQGAKSNTMWILVIVLAVLLGVAVVCGGILVALMLPAVQAARNAARMAMVENNGRNIGFAMQMYEQANGQLPAAVITDSDGIELSGWRFAILPFIEGQNNATLHSRMPTTYGSPFDEDLESTTTHFFTIRHPNGMMPGEMAVRLNDVTDGLSQTLMAVYVQEKSAEWASAQDISLPELQNAVSKATLKSPVFFVLGDASTYRVTAPIPPEQVEALVTRAGGEAPVVLP